MTTDVRAHLLNALEADLIGPYDVTDPMAVEVLSIPPSRWYLAGFLAPQEGRNEIEDPEDDEELAAGPDEDEEETSGQEPEPKQRQILPASMGLSVLVPKNLTAITARLRYADYVPEEVEDPEKKRAKRRTWRRVPRPEVSIELPLDAAKLLEGVEVENSGGIVLSGKLEDVDDTTRALAVFVVNQREKGEKGPFDEAFIFQVRLELEAETGFVRRVNRQGEGSLDPDDRVAELQYRDRCEYAVGHGIAATVDETQHPVNIARTCWIPRSEVRTVVTHEDKNIVTDMETLANTADGKVCADAIRPLIDAYGEWIKTQAAIALDSEDRRATRDALVARANAAKTRIAQGLDRLEKEPEIFEAFRLMNRAMATAARQRSPERYRDGRAPAWRLFQLAFVLLNISGLAEETHADREIVDLIFFPTGGGKTEAYLGVIAFLLLLRRLRGRSRPDGGYGVAVLLRYTLRLLTLDQLGRAATLICALERLRLETPQKLGDVRFAVGLWVGRTATANTIRQASKQVKEYKNNPSDKAASPFPLTNCPWCQTQLTRSSLELSPSSEKPDSVMVGCPNFECPFARANNTEGLPVLFVDDQIYRELPAFIVGTVDKFAMLPWRGETGMLFGRAKARSGRAFYGPLDRVKKGMILLPEGLRPPELIVQDELHLISGPLGTMVGLYETAIEALCSRQTNSGHTIRPKIIASTATVRRAGEQIRALFGRTRTQLFPPPGVDASETYFAKVDYQNPGRLYAGVAAQGRALKAILLRAYVALLTGARKVYDPDGKPDQTADGYMTVAGYFNSLRELGGMRRLVEDDVRTRSSQIEDRRPIDAQPPHRWFANRKIQEEPVELTSRENVFRIKEAKARLTETYQSPKSVDVLLASNMISVGVDIDRLGLMVIAGQPKTTSEYIQASSRVGRDAKWPGLVITCFNLHKPRDRSQYERFDAYHQSFYRFVEATSATPFSGPALDRGFAGTLVAMARLLDPVLTPPFASMEIEPNRSIGEKAARSLAERATAQPGVGAEEEAAIRAAIGGRGQNLLDAWTRLVDAAKKGAGKQAYSPYDDAKVDNPLLHLALEDDLEPGSDEAKFVAPTSMRDVEPSVHLWLQRTTLGGKTG